MADRAAEQTQQSREEDVDKTTAQMDHLAVANDQANKLAAAGSTGEGQRAKVLYDYQADEDNELSLEEGEVLTGVEEIDEGWWTGHGKHGDGMFPAK